MMRITETVKHLIIINVIIFFGYSLLENSFRLPDLAIHFPGPNGNFKPYQLISHMFMHGDTSHLFFNMLMLFFMGPIVEQRLGQKKFLTLYLAAGLLSTIFVWGVNLTGLTGTEYLVRGSVGASGAIFGVIAAFGLLFPNMQVMLLIPPIPIKGKYLALALLIMGYFMDRGGNVGHLAHLGGALIGAGMIFYWKNNRLV